MVLTSWEFIVSAHITFLAEFILGQKNNQVFDSRKEKIVLPRAKNYGGHHFFHIIFTVCFFFVSWALDIALGTTSFFSLLPFKYVRFLLFLFQFATSARFLLTFASAPHHCHRSLSLAIITIVITSFHTPFSFFFSSFVLLLSRNLHFAVLLFSLEFLLSYWGYVSLSLFFSPFSTASNGMPSPLPSSLISLCGCASSDRQAHQHHWH